MKSALVECLGTFFLVFVIGLTLLAPGAGAMAPVAIGAILMVMVYAGGPISGAHYNPAVTLAAWMRGKCPSKDAPSYVGAQMVGAVLAALLVGVCRRGGYAAAPRVEALPALLVEFCFTFALAFVVLNVATVKRTAGNSYYGLAIGATVTAAAYAGGAISGGAFNPAVAVGLTLMGLSDIANLWILLAGSLAGGAAAAVVFRVTSPDRD